MLNIYQGVQSILKADRIMPGGLCRILAFQHEDVLAWPSRNPETSVIDTAVDLKPGKSFYQVIASEKDRTFSEELKRAAEGPYFDIQVTSTVPGNTITTTLSVEAMIYHRWGLILKDRNGEQRLVGDEDSGAEFSFGYSPADITGSRKRQLRFTWQSPLSLPLYLPEAFNINVGGVIVTAGSLQLIQRFRVGDPGAPMVDGQELLNNAGFAGKNLLVIASGIALACDDGTGSIDFTGSIERHYEKTYASATLKFVGGVVNKELIEIYAWT